MSKYTIEGVHLIVELPAISLQVCKFTKKELLHRYFSRILGRFEVIIYFMEGCFMFQWGRLFFRWGGGASFLNGGSPNGHQFCWEGV